MFKLFFILTISFIVGFILYKLYNSPQSNHSNLFQINFKTPEELDFKINQLYCSKVPSTQPPQSNSLSIQSLSKINQSSKIPSEIPSKKQLQLVEELKNLFQIKFQIPVKDEWLIYTLNTIPKSSSNSQHIILDIVRHLYAHKNTPIMSKLLMAQYIINRSMSNSEIERLYSDIQTIGSNSTHPFNVSANALDILKLSNNPRYMLRAENILAQQRREHVPNRTQNRVRNQFNPELNQDLPLQHALFAQFNRTPRKKSRQKTLYNDSQNVHDSSINNSVLDTMKELNTQYKNEPNINFRTIMEQAKTPEQRKRIQKAYNRILSDESHFSGGLTLKSAFENTLKHISQHPHQKELEQRLLEEMSEMSGTCATGHLSRLVNTLHGFEDRIKMDPKEEVYAKLSHTIQKRAQDDESIMDVIMDPSSQKFKETVHTIADELRPVLKTEYTTHSETEIDEALNKAVKKYSGE